MCVSHIVAELRTGKGDNKQELGKRDINSVAELRERKGGQRVRKLGIRDINSMAQLQGRKRG